MITVRYHRLFKLLVLLLLLLFLLLLLLYWHSPYSYFSSILTARAQEIKASLKQSATVGQNSRVSPYSLAL